MIVSGFWTGPKPFALAETDKQSRNQDLKKVKEIKVVKHVTFLMIVIEIDILVLEILQG